MTDTTTAPRPPQRPSASAAYADALATLGDERDAPERLLAGTRRDMPARSIRAAAAEGERWEDGDRVPVFTVDHEDGSQDVYTMPAKPNPGIMLGFLRDANARGEVAQAALLERCLGVEAVDALQRELEQMDGDEGLALMRSISERIQRNLAGGLK